MDEARDDTDEHAEAQNRADERLDGKTRAALSGVFGIAHHVEDAGGDPDETEHRRAPIADVIGEQPQERQEDRHPLQRVHLHAENAVEFGLAAHHHRRLQAEFQPGARHARARVKIKDYGEHRDQCGVVRHGEPSLSLRAAL